MSVSDPLLDDLKGCVRRLLTWTQAGSAPGGRDINDSCDALPALCARIEEVLQKGLLVRRGLFGAQPQDAWHWLQSVADCTSTPYNFQSAGTFARKNAKVKTPRGRLRLLIRTCLNNRCLHVPVDILLRSGQQNEVYGSGAVLGDEILAQILLSVLLQLSRLSFRLALSNARFLDETWRLPDAAQHELVPCAAIGLGIAIVDSLAVVVSVLPGSVAEENEQIEPGDVLDEINGTVLTSRPRGGFKAIMRRAANKPVMVTVIKLFFPDGGAYAPLMSLLQSSNIASEIDKAVKSRTRNKQAVEEHVADKMAANGKQVEKKNRSGFTAFFVGQRSTGHVGDIRCIEKALAVVLAQAGSAQPQPITFECQEVGVRVSLQPAATVLLSHSYMEMSACGQVRAWPNHFAYIAGDDSPTCNQATSFTCYIFFSSSAREVEDILVSIGQGFTRTHYAV